MIGIVGTAPDSSYPTCASLLWGSELADNLVEFSTVMPGADGNNWIVEIVDLGINGNVATPGYSTLPDGSRKLTMITDGAMTPSKMYDQNQQYKEGLRLENILTSHSVVITQERGLYSRSPTNLSGGKDESFKYNVPTLIAGSQKSWIARWVWNPSSRCI